MDSVHETVVFATRKEIKLFLDTQNKMDLLSARTEDDWKLRLAYVLYIFGYLNFLNVELQGKESLIIDFVEISSQTSRLLRNPFTAPVTFLPGDNDAA